MRTPKGAGSPRPPIDVLAPRADTAAGSAGSDAYDRSGPRTLAEPRAQSSADAAAVVFFAAVFLAGAFFAVFFLAGPLARFSASSS